MTKKSAFAALGHLPSAPVLVLAGGAVLCLALAAWIFAPGGLLDSLTAPPSEEVFDQQEAELSEALSLEKNAAFLADNANKPGVTTTASGLQFKVLKPGEGKQPGPTSTVTVHYAGALINGAEFDSSYGRGEPISFPLNRVIPGWTEGLQLMREGETAELVIPQDLGYGAGGSGRSIPPYQTLVFKVELIKVR